MPQIVAENLSVWRGFSRVVGDLSFSVDGGQILWLQGANGAGKTTLLRALAGLLPYDGKILWDGADIGADPGAYQHHLGWLGHTDGVRGELTVLENAALLAGSNDDNTLTQILSQFGLSDKSDIPAQFLSQGQRKRIGLAALSLQNSKKLWLLDEPFAHLDEGAARNFAGILAARQKSGLASIIASHQPIGDLRVESLHLGQGA